MYCNQCGKEVSEKSRFCCYCGVELAFGEFEKKIVSETQVTSDDVITQKQEIPKEKSIKNIIWCSMGVGILVAFTVLLWSLIESENAPETMYMLVFALIYMFCLIVATSNLIYAMNGSGHLKKNVYKKIKMTNAIMAGCEVGCGGFVMLLGTDPSIAGVIGFLLWGCSAVHIVFYFFVEQWEYEELSMKMAECFIQEENAQGDKYRVSIQDVRKLAPYECELRDCAYVEENPVCICKFKLISQNNTKYKFEALVTNVDDEWYILKIEPGKKMDEDTSKCLIFAEIVFGILIVIVFAIEICSHNAGSNKEPDEAVELYFAKASTGNDNAVLKVIYPLYKEIHKETDVDKKDYYGWYLCEDSFEYSDLEIEEQKIYNDGSYVENELAQLIVDANVFVDIDDYEVDKAVEYEGTVRIDGVRTKFETLVIKMDGKWYVGYMEIWER